jgi:DMSO/TMAO reductase YedYZ molybdopterin-dependent catalytic subunit
MSGEQDRQLPPRQHVAAPGKWPLVGEKLPRASSEAWTVSVTGLIARPCVWSLHELQAMPQVERSIEIHCVTRWSMLGTRFSGLPLRALLDLAGTLPAARYVSFVARSERNHSTSLPLATALELDALIALSWQGKPMETAHGGPVRVVVPGRYFYKSLKWLERIELLADDRLGYWEREAGYHNVADPWLEQRYVAADLDARTVRELLAKRDFSGRSLTGLEAARLDLTGLDARGALLRNVNFRDTKLSGARFDGANLSNAHLEGADLRRASFGSYLGKDADVEGASFQGADLRGTDFSGASLFGVTFCGEDAAADSRAARIDATTKIDAAGLDQLAPAQREFVAAALKGPPANA